MKRIMLLLALICLEKTLHAQTPHTPYIYTIKADSVKITNTCDTAELIIENHTQTVPGFLFNKGRGRTEFRRVSQFNDTSVVIGGDTVHLGRGYKNFANADLTFDDDHLHNGAYHSMNLTDFSKIGLKSNNTDGSRSAELSMTPYPGFNLTVNEATDPDNVRYSLLYQSSRSLIHTINTSTPDVDKGGGFSVGDTRAYMGTDNTDLNTGNWVSAGVETGVLTDYDPMEVDVFSENGTMRLYTTNEADQIRIETNFNRGYYWTNSVWDYINGTSTIKQTYDGFKFSASTDIPLTFKLPGLPVSGSSEDSVLVIDGEGQVKKQAQSNLTPALNIINGNIADITAPVDAVTKLPHLYSNPGHSVILPPAASNAGKKIYIWNLNYSTSVWTFSSSITLPDGSTSNAIPNQSTIELLSNGEVWIKWK